MSSTDRQTDRRTDGQTDRRTRWIQYTPPPTSLGGGITNNRDLNKVFYIYGPNLVILAETGHELSRRQACDWRTDGHTHRQMQATTIPEGQNWPRVKNPDPAQSNHLSNMLEYTLMAVQKLKLYEKM